MTTLLEIIRDLDALASDDEESTISTIYAAEPWTEDSRAIAARQPEDGGLPAEAKQLNLGYFIEVDIARDFLEGWTENLGAEPALRERCARLIQYAITDA